MTTDTRTVMNPFHVWGQLTRDLRDRFVRELGPPPYTAYTATLLGSLASMVTRCEHLGVVLGDVAERDAEAFDAFCRAMDPDGESQLSDSIVQLEAGPQ